MRHGKYWCYKLSIFTFPPKTDKIYQLWGRPNFFLFLLRRPEMFSGLFSAAAFTSRLPPGRSRKGHGARPWRQGRISPPFFPTFLFRKLLWKKAKKEESLEALQGRHWLCSLAVELCNQKNVLSFRLPLLTLVNFDHEGQKSQLFRSGKNITTSFPKKAFYQGHDLASLEAQFSCISVYSNISSIPFFSRHFKNSRSRQTNFSSIGKGKIEKKPFSTWTIDRKTENGVSSFFLGISIYGYLPFFSFTFPVHVIQARDMLASKARAVLAFWLNGRA